MTNISHDKTMSADFSATYKTLKALVAKLNRTSATYLLEDLLTETERIMIVKRFGAIFMFHHNYSTYRISRTLALSLSTTQRLQAQYDSGAFDRILACLTKTQQNQFLLFLNDLILAQASPQARARLINRASKGTC